MALAASLLCPPTAVPPSWTPRAAALPLAMTLLWPCPLLVTTVSLGLGELQWLRWHWRPAKHSCAGLQGKVEPDPNCCHCRTAEEYLKENIKSAGAMKGQAVFSIAKVDAATGEIAGVFESVQPSDTDLGAKAPKDVKITGLW